MMNILGFKIHSLSDDLSFLTELMDILEDERVQSMALIRHHNASTLEHSLIVAQLSYNLAKTLKLDARSCARGAILHDFFLYDWRDKKHPHHATQHASRALKNAKDRFILNPIEQDIILTHMWPLSSNWYSYKESVLVSIIDKVASAKDCFSILKAELIPKAVRRVSTLPHSIMRALAAARAWASKKRLFMFFGKPS